MPLRWQGTGCPCRGPVGHSFCFVGAISVACASTVLVSAQCIDYGFCEFFDRAIFAKKMLFNICYIWYLYIYDIYIYVCVCIIYLICVDVSLCYDNLYNTRNITHMQSWSVMARSSAPPCGACRRPLRSSTPRCGRATWPGWQTLGATRKLRDFTIPYAPCIVYLPTKLGHKNWVSMLVNISAPWSIWV